MLHLTSSLATNRTTSDTTDSMYDLKDVPSKGKGLVASRSIPQGTRILCEEAIIHIPHSHSQWGSKKLQSYVREQVNALTEQQ